MRIKLDGIAEKFALPFKKKLYIASPSYDGKFVSDFVTSILKTSQILKDHNIDFIIKFLTNDAFIERARNTIVADFMSSDCTHLLQIDSDQGWDADKVLMMLNYDKDIIAGVVPIKDKSCENYVIQIDVDANGVPNTDKDGLLSANLIGTAFLMVRRNVFEKLRERLSVNIWCPQVMPNYYSYFEITKDLGKFWGEDMTFCRRCKDAGFEIKIMPDINMIHIGQKEFHGNYHEYLLKQPQPKIYEGIKLL